MRFEMELERMKQIHQKELEDKEEELEDVHKSSQRRVGGHFKNLLTSAVNYLELEVTGRFQVVPLNRHRLRFNENIKSSSLFLLALALQG